jgi:hypothetical protein
MHEQSAERGFIKLQRGPSTEGLFLDKNAFHLLTVIAYRARWTDQFNIHNLKRGQALIGDYKDCDLTRKEYRKACDRLVKWGFISLQPTPKGTIASLSDSRVFSLVDERKSQEKGHLEGHLFSEEKTGFWGQQAGQRGAIEGPSEGQRGATNSEGEEREKGERENLSPFSPHGELGREASGGKTIAQTRAEKLFNKQLGTAWDSAESRAWKKNLAAIASTSETDWALLEWLYASTAPAEAAKNNRHALATLLNNWNGEISRARNYRAKSSKSTVSGSQFV